MRDTAAIIVAGGKGLRFGGLTRKQYLSLRGHPILWWSLEAFRKSPSIAEIVLVVPSDDLKTQNNPALVPGTKVQRSASLGSPAVRVVAGGGTRADSVREGLKAVSPKIRWVAVHDAVRPLVKPALIEETLRQARRYRAAIAAAPSRDTVKLANGDGCIESTPHRESVWLAQTPQIFERKLLERAHAGGRRLKVTDDAQLVEQLGVRVRLVKAPPENLKITEPMDFILANAILKREG